VSALSDILAQPIGAQFLRADLHIHSYGASHDVKDASMTSAAIIQTAAKEGLSIVAITDHNEISNVEPALEAARGGLRISHSGRRTLDSPWAPPVLCTNT
jgi:predicted metal-dependent phosphoesterase TrpH